MLQRCFMVAGSHAQQPHMKVNLGVKSRRIEQADRERRCKREGSPRAGVSTGHPGSAVQAAAPVPDKGVKVPGSPDLGHLVWVVGTHHRQALPDGIIVLQHPQHLPAQTGSRSQIKGGPKYKAIQHCCMCILIRTAVCPFISCADLSQGVKSQNNATRRSCMLCTSACLKQSQQSVQ